MTEQALTATLKASGNHDAPWIVVRADRPEDFKQRLESIISLDLHQTVVEAQQAFSAFWNLADGLGAQAAPTDSPPVAAAPAVAAPVSAPAASPWDATAAPPAEPQPAAPAAPAATPASNIEKNAWATYEHGHAAAPMTAAGPAVLKRATSKAGKPYARWVDPRAKEIPSNYQAGARQDPPDLWPGDFARV